mmetsp:Transcript_8191/g.17778  ORF Transcript_8191/g.17778 Transcript_8191/m.17778 type:complete len:283 (-) Transcript_8191:380-1228(-)
MLLRDPHIERPRRVGLLENSHPSPAGHGRRDSHDAVVLVCFLHQLVCEDLGKGRALRLGDGRLGGPARGDVEGDDAVELVVGLFRGGVAFPFLGNHMQEHRPPQAPPLLALLNVIQHRHHVPHCMAINRPHVVEPQLLEQAESATCGEPPPDPLVHSRAKRQEGRGEDRPHEGLGRISRRGEPRASHQPRHPPAPPQPQHLQRLRQRPHRLVHSVVLGGQGDLPVVVEDHEHVGAEECGVVHGLEGHPPGEGSVPDHGDDALVPPGEVPGGGVAQGGGNGGG